MSRLGDRSFRAFSRLLRVLPVTPMLVLVAVLYAGGFALPLAAHWKTASLVMYSC